MKKESKDGWRKRVKMDEERVKIDEESKDGRGERVKMDEERE